MLGHVFALGRPFFDFCCFFCSSHLYRCFTSFFHRFVSILDRFLEVWGWFGDGFGKVVSMLFGIIIENRIFLKNSVLPKKNHYFQGFDT